MIKSYLTKGKQKVNKTIQEIVSQDGITSFQESPDKDGRERINAAELFSFFTASIIKKKVTFTR
jgi:hypothetical protein